MEIVRRNFPCSWNFRFFKENNKHLYALEVYFFIVQIKYSLNNPLNKVLPTRDTKKVERAKPGKRQCMRTTYLASSKHVIVMPCLTLASSLLYLPCLINKSLIRTFVHSSWRTQLDYILEVTPKF